MKAYVRVLVFAMAIGLLVSFPLAVRPVSAHEHVTVGAYELIVGWRDEPAVVGYVNGLDLGIQHHLPNGTTAWVTGADGTLNATLSTGPALVHKSLEPQFGRDGWYTFDVIPARFGTYTVRLNGSVESTAVDVAVDLDPVIPASDLAFPDPPASELQGRLDAANAAIAGLQLLVALALAAAFLGIIVAVVSLALGRRISRGQGKTP